METLDKIPQDFVKNLLEKHRTKSLKKVYLKHEFSIWIFQNVFEIMKH